MRDIVIGCITGYDFDKIKPWVNSLDTCGFDGVKAMICYDVNFKTVEELTKRNYTVLAFNRDEEKKTFFSSSLLKREAAKNEDHNSIQLFVN